MYNYSHGRIGMQPGLNDPQSGVAAMKTSSKKPQKPVPPEAFGI